MRRWAHRFRALVAICILCLPAPVTGGQESVPPAEDPPTPAVDTQLLFEQGCRELRDGRFEAAIECLSRVLAAGVVDRDFHEKVLNSRSIAHLGRLDLQAAYEDALWHHDKRNYHLKFERYGTEENTTRGIIFALTGDLARARLEFARTFGMFGRQDPYARIYFTLVSDGTALLGPFENLAEWPGPVIRHLRGTGTAESLLGEASQAADEQQRRRQILDAHLALGVWSEREGRIEEALRHYEGAIATHLFEEGGFHWARGSIARHAGRLPPFSPLQETLFGYMDRKGNTVIAPRFRSAFAFSGGTAEVQLAGCASKRGLIDRAGRFLVPPIYAEVGRFSKEGLAYVKKSNHGAFGYVDRSGKLAISMRYLQATEFKEGLAAVQVAVGEPQVRRVGFIDANGAWAIEPRFDFADAFSEGVAKVRSGADQPWYLIDRMGQQSGALQSFQFPEFSEGLAAVQIEKGGLIGYMEPSGSMVIAPRFSAARGFSEGRAAVKSGDVAAGTRWYYVDRTGSRVGTLSCKGKSFPEFASGLVVFEQDGRYGYCALDGRVVIEPTFGDADSFANGFGRVASFGKHGFVSTKGELLAGTWFEDVWSFREGLAAVRTRTGWGYIDTEGAWAIPPCHQGHGHFSEGLVDFEGNAAPEALQPIDVNDFEEHFRADLLRVQASQRFQFFLDSIPAEVCRLAATVERVPFRDPDERHVQKNRLLKDVLEATRRGDVGVFYDLLLSEYAQAEHYYWRCHRRREDNEEIPETIQRFIMNTYEGFRSEAVEALSLAIVRGNVGPLDRIYMSQLGAPLRLSNPLASLAGSTRGGA